MSDTVRVSTRGVFISIVVLAIFGSLSLVIANRFENAHRVTVPIEQLPKEADGWVGKSASAMKRTSREILKLDRYVRRTYSHPDYRGEVFLYIGYWTHQTGEHQAAKHTPSLCLPANGWTINPLGVSPMTLPFANGEAELQVNRLVGELGNYRSLVYYWFMNGSDYYPEEWQSLARISWSAMLGRRTDGGIVEIMVDLPEGPDSQKEAERTMNAFLKTFHPLLDDLVRNQGITVSSDGSKESVALN